MSEPLESYALLGDMRSAALVSRAGSIDWLTFPRFDSPACCSALLGTPADGRWLLAPAEPFEVRRRYRGDSLVLETTFETASGVARVVDAMLLGAGRRLARLVEGISGSVVLTCIFEPRFDYGSVAPWLVVDGREAVAVAGPDALLLRAEVPLVAMGSSVRATFSVAAGESVAFGLAYYRSHKKRPDIGDLRAELQSTERWWRDWAGSCNYNGAYREAVIRSLLVLKALTFAPTGAIVAAPTTSLPERIGGIRNWDYRYCWLRDATFTVLALANASRREEATAFTEWLMRAIAGDPSKLQIMYGVGGERRLDEVRLPWLQGYAGSKPVRIGNAAFAQFQLDVYGEVIDALWQAVRAGMPPHPSFWPMLRGIVEFVGGHWRSPADHGMWEIRGKPRHFVQSKVMAWVAFDRVVRAVEEGQLEGPLQEWRALRERIHAEVLARGFDAARNTFTQYYGGSTVDAGLLLLSQVGFLPVEDPRMRGTIAAIERDLFRSPFVARYLTDTPANVDGLPGDEGAFLACSFWLADNFVLGGRRAEAQALFEQLLTLRNDVGLLSEEYDPAAKRMIGNFPQAFSHLALVNTAFNLSRLDESPVEQRSKSSQTEGRT